MALVSVLAFVFRDIEPIFSAGLDVIRTVMRAHRAVHQVSIRPSFFTRTACVAELNFFSARAV